MGRYVTLKRNGNGRETHVMNICEVQIYGYFYRGKGLNNTACKETCVHDTCRGQIFGSRWGFWYEIYTVFPDDISQTNPYRFIE